jgi:hypothetical protein
VEPGFGIVKLSGEALVIRRASGDLLRLSEGLGDRVPDQRAGLVRHLLRRAQVVRVDGADPGVLDRGEGVLQGKPNGLEKNIKTRPDPFTAPLPCTALWREATDRPR